MALDLGKQVGPLPLGAWIAVVGGGLGIGWYFSKGSGTGGDNPDDQLVPVTEPGVGTGGGQFIYDPPTSVDNPNTNVITDNATWGRQATNWLISQGYDSGMAVTAVTKFLNGTNRSLLEQTLINLALNKFGVPPEDVPLPETPVNPPTQPPPTQLAKYTIHTVVAGETIGSIANRYKTSWWNIYVANDAIGLRPDGSKGVMTGPWSTRPGMKLVIPTLASGGLAPLPTVKAGPIRYYTPGNGETVSTISGKFNVHPARIFEANDIGNPRPDGTPGFLTNPSQIVPKGRKLVIPYQ